MNKYYCEWNRHVIWNDSISHNYVYWYGGFLVTSNLAIINGNWVTRRKSDNLETDISTNYCNGKSLCPWRFHLSSVVIIHLIGYCFPGIWTPWSHFKLSHSWKLRGHNYWLDYLRGSGGWTSKRRPWKKMLFFQGSAVPHHAQLYCYCCIFLYPSL